MNNLPDPNDFELNLRMFDGRLYELVSQLRQTEHAVSQFLNGERKVVAASGITPLLIRQAREALVDSYKRYRQLMEQVPTAVFELDYDGIIQFANAPALAITGYRLAELIGQDFFSFLLPAFSEEEIQQVRQGWNQAELKNHELTITGKNGRSVTLLWNTVHEYGGNGTVEKIVACGLDISTNKQHDLRKKKADFSSRGKLKEFSWLDEVAYTMPQGQANPPTSPQAGDAALPHCEGQFRSLFQHSPLPILIYRQDNFKFIAVNEAAVQKYGYSREQFAQMSLPDLYPARIKKILLGLQPETAVPLLHAGYWAQVTAEGEQLDVEIKLFDLIFNDLPAKVTLVHDITDKKKLENSLRQNEELLRQIMENTQEVFWIRDLQTDQILHVNNVYEKVWQRPISELYANPTSFVQSIHPDDRQHLFEARSQQKNKIFSQKFRLVRPDGSIRWIKATGFPIKNDVGESVRVAVTARDITNRIQRQNSLLAVEEIAFVLRDVENHADITPAILHKLQEIFATPHVMLTMVDEAAAEEQIELGYGLFASLTGFHRPISDGIVGQVIRTGLPYFTNSAGEATFELPIDASFSLSGTAVVPLIVHQKTIGVLTLCTDNALTENQYDMLITIVEMMASAIRRAMLHKQTQAHAKQLSHILETIPIGLLLLDEENTVIEANSAGKQILALLADSKVGSRIHHLGGRPFDELLAKLRYTQQQFELAVDEPAPLIYEISANPIAVLDTEKGCVLQLRDVTRERAVQQKVTQQERLAAVGQLAAGISHDFNNIISVITIQAQLLSRGDSLTAEAHRRVDLIYQQANHASDLIRQILDFSRRSVMEKADLNLVPILQELEKLWRRTLPATIKLNVVAEHQKIVAPVDLTRLQQVLMNLVLNARDAMPQGGDLNISLQKSRYFSQSPQPEMPPGRWIQLSVQDSGLGIPAEILPCIFEPFFTTKPANQGTGLGLAQVYGIVKQHEGFIFVNSSEEEGTTFDIFLPGITTEKDEAVTPSIPGIVPVPGGKILLCEDDKYTREAVVELMEEMGYSVLIANNGETAVRLYQQHHNDISLVLSDMVMPKMSGLQLYKTLTERYPNVKMVIMTGYPLENDGKALLEQGILKWLFKPFSSEQLYDAIKESLKINP